MDNVNALKAVYVALGGSEADIAGITSNPDMIKALAALINDNGISTLPDPSEANDGDVLTVADGEWKAQAPSGGGGAGTFEVTFSVDNDTWSADKTFAELKAAINGGHNIRGLMAGERTICLTLDGWYFAEGDTESVYFSFMAPMQGESSWTLGKEDFTFSDDESVSVEVNSFLLTPAT